MQNCRPLKIKDAAANACSAVEVVVVKPEGACQKPLK
jgi:hypothetical protein